MAPEIVRLAGGLLNNPIEVSVATPTSTVEKVSEKVLFVDDDNKRALLSDILKKAEIGRTLVFTRTKRGADRLVKHLDRAAIKANAIHGDKSQAARTAALRDFRFGRCNVLVATDIASRGIDVTGITHVINYDLPREPEAYIHRIGRTARAGAEGVAISLCGSEDRSCLRNIERMLKRSVPVCMDHAYHCEYAAKAHAKSTSAPSRFKHSSRRSGGKRAPWHKRKSSRGSGHRTSSAAN
jgi:ATP-dependent RNA helicase RhlE